MALSEGYMCWYGMRVRCSDKMHPSYHLYGGRGIKVCKRWKDSFEAFKGDMGPRPSMKHTLDRIDNDGNYEPGNVRWATIEEQNANRRPNCRSKKYTWQGESLLIVDWSKKVGIPATRIYERIVVKGWSVDKALSTPVRKMTDRDLTYQGKTQSVSKWWKETGISKQTITRRMDAGWPVERIFEIPLYERHGVR